MTDHHQSPEEQDPSIAATQPTEHEQEVAEYEEGSEADGPLSASDPRIEAGTHEDAQADLAADQGRDRSEDE